MIEHNLNLAQLRSPLLVHRSTRTRRHVTFDVRVVGRVGSCVRRWFLAHRSAIDVFVERPTTQQQQVCKEWDFECFTGRSLHSVDVFVGLRFTVAVVLIQQIPLGRRHS